ncbi:MAG: hypothetical protein AB7G87_09155 [Clostridia bacterium]
MSEKYISISPFIYRNYQRICENTKKSISFGEIIKLSKDNKLHKIHLDILQYLYEYRYLTSHFIELLAGSAHISIGKGQTITIKQSISFMVKKGMILRHYFLTTPAAEDDSEKKGTSSEEVEDNVEDMEEEEYLNSIRSVYFYTLSKGAASYMASLKEKTIPDPEQLNKMLHVEEPYKVLQTLSVNQFIIINNNKPKGIDLTFELNVTVDVDRNDDKLYIPAYGYKKKDNSTRQFAVFAVRNNPGWREELSISLQKLKSYIQQQSAEGKIQQIPFIILICETDFHIRQAFKAISAIELNMQVLYTTDVRQINNDFNENLLQISEDQTTGNTIYTEYVSPVL